ncbi:hypothetical protein KFU94_10555 [Chloroflexi bacterium TSY]|nr:hypothetical protein [Chloroflexi bacterium TSY]
MQLPIVNVAPLVKEHSETFRSVFAGWFILGGQLGLHFCKEKRCLYFLI